MAGDDHAVKAVEEVFPGAAALIAERDGDGLGGGEGGGDAGRPEAAAVPFAAGGIIFAVDANADGGGGVRQGRTPFLRG